MNFHLARIPYAKPWLSYEDQVKKLQQRGLIVDDPQAAAQFLLHLNYYRFSGYCFGLRGATPPAHCWNDI